MDAVKKAILPGQYDNQTLILDGFVCGLPRTSEYSRSADFCLNAVQTVNGLELPGEGYKVKLRWPLALNMPEQPLLIEARVRQSRATVNFVGIPYEKYLFYQGVIFNASLLRVVERQDIAALELYQQIQLFYHQLRLKVARFSETLLAGLSHEGILRALLLGDRSSLSGDDARLLSNTGTQHLIAISGLHVGIVMLGLYALLPKSPLSLVAVAGLGAVYILLVGFGPSAQRAWVMCLLGLLYMSGFLRQGKWSIYLLALFFVLLMDPMAPLHSGFWFSFICVAILLMIFAGLQVTEHPWRTFLYLQLLLMLGLVPFYSALGIPNGPSNILANLVAVPWISILILPLLLFGFLVCLLASVFSDVLLGYAKSLFWLLDDMLELLMVFFQSLSLFSRDWLFAPTVCMTMAYLLCYVVLLLFFRFNIIRLVFLPAMLLMLVAASRLQDFKNEFLVFDAGQGLAIAMSFEGQTWLFDTGPALGRQSTVDQTILPYLRASRQLAGTTGLIVSHGDADHAGDVASLVEELYKPVLVSGEPERLGTPRRFEQCRSGMRWFGKLASLEVLYPLKNEATDSGYGISSNNLSCVLLFQLAGKRFLLMGDLEAEAEMALVKHYRHLLKADVLVAGHHGAYGSTSYALLKHVRPDYVVFSSGYANAFGHPSVKVIERITKLRVAGLRSNQRDTFQMLNTAEHGALRFEVGQNANQLDVSTARQLKDALWIGGDFID